MKSNVSTSLDRFNLTFPCIQGGMGIGISRGALAGAVMREGCIGVIASAQLGFMHPRYRENPFDYDLEALEHEIKIARQTSSGNGILGVNLMVASRRYPDYARALGRMPIDILFCGAGLPLDLPEYVNNPDILLGVILSSAKALTLLCNVWDKKYARIPDLVVFEGCAAGGHLGFTREAIENNTCETVETMLEKSKETIEFYQSKHKKRMRVYVAGGIHDGYDMKHYLDLGADGVQLGTRFAVTDESSAPSHIKQRLVACVKEEIRLTKSPSGMIGRCLTTRFAEEINSQTENISVNDCIGCLRNCDPNDTPFCLYGAIIAAIRGDIESGMILCGSQAYRIDKTLSVKELIEELRQSLKDAYGKE